MSFIKWTVAKHIFHSIWISIFLMNVFDSLLCYLRHRQRAYLFFFSIDRRNKKVSKKLLRPFIYTLTTLCQIRCCCRWCRLKTLSIFWIWQQLRICKDIMFFLSLSFDHGKFSVTNRFLWNDKHSMEQLVLMKEWLNLIKKHNNLVNFRDKSIWI